MRPNRRPNEQDNQPTSDQWSGSRLCGACYPGHYPFAENAGLDEEAHLFLVPAKIGRQQRQHDEVGDDLKPNADGRDNGDVPHNPHRDQVERDKAHQVCDERHGAGDQQSTEGLPGSVKAIRPFGNLGCDQIDLLHAVAHPNRVDQEGDENGKRVKPHTNQIKHTQLPDDRNE